MKKILYLQYTNPAAYPSLEHGSRILASRGWSVIFVGTGAFGAASFRFRPHPNVRVRQMRFVAGGWRQRLNYLLFCAWAVMISAAERPSWIYASDPVSCPPALFLSRLGFRVAYHEHDSPAPSGAKGLMKAVFGARRGLARRAAFCVLPNEERAKDFAAETGAEDVLCIWNCPSLEEVDARPKDASETWLFYHGSITPVRLPMTLLDALAALPADVKLRVVGYRTLGFADYEDRFRKKAADLGLAARVQIVGAVEDRSQLLAWCAKSRLGVAFMPKRTEDRNEKDMVGASNKPFEYLACGLGLLVSDLPAWRKTFVEPGYGDACDPADAASIAAAVRRLMQEPGRIDRMGAAGRERILKDWNYESQFAQVLKRLEEAA